MKTPLVSECEYGNTEKLARAFADSLCVHVVVCVARVTEAEARERNGIDLPGQTSQEEV